MKYLTLVQARVALHRAERFQRLALHQVRAGLNPVLFHNAAQKNLEAFEELMNQFNKEEAHE